MLDRFLDWVLQLAPLPTYAVLSLLSAVENVFPPVPADVAVALGAFLSQQGRISAWVLGLSCWSANQASATAVYFFARRRGPAFFTHGYGRRLLPPSAFSALKEASDRYGLAGIFLSRFLPGLRAGVLPFAGAIGMKPWPTLATAGAASALWYAFLVAAGVTLGKSLPAVRHLVEDASRLLGLVGVAALAAAAFWLWRRTRNRSD